MATARLIIAVALSLVALGAGVGLTVAAAGGSSRGDAGQHQYGAKPACAHKTKGKAKKSSTCPKADRGRR